VTTKYTLPNHNISTNPVYIKAQANGDGASNLQEPDSTTLLSSSVSPLADACRTLRVRGGAPTLVVTILEPKVSGAYASGAAGEIGGYGYKAIGLNAGV
jgi:hypothetical protein